MAKFDSGQANKFIGIDINARRSDSLNGIRFGGNRTADPTSASDTILYRIGDVLKVWNGSEVRTITTVGSTVATVAINSTATATAAQVVTGYITSTSAAATTITLPTGTLLGAALGAVKGTVHNLYIDNTAGANTVTIAVAVNGILSTGAADTAGSFGDLTVASGVTGQARYTLMFSSATAYTFTRTA